MKALILNSGRGSRMGHCTELQPKCMTTLDGNETILSRQLSMLRNAGITNIIITTGEFDQMIQEYCMSAAPDLQYIFVKNPMYDKTNYIYSIHLAREYLEGDLLLMHGDLVFDDGILQGMMNCSNSCMAICKFQELPQKDFKAVISGSQKNGTGHIEQIGVDCFENAYAAQPLYYLRQQDSKIWINQINAFCENGKITCYAENAFNEVSDQCLIYPYEVGELICGEVDTLDDLYKMRERLKENMKNVYMCFSTDMIHGGHIGMIEKAAKLGNLTIGVLTDEVVASYKRYPLLSFEERCNIIKNIKGVDTVILQNSLSYKENLLKLRPDIVVHGDDWKNGIQKSIREETITILESYGGTLREFPYTANPEYDALEKYAKEQLSIPDMRRGRLRKLLGIKQLVTALEAHSGITGLLCEEVKVEQNGCTYQFDAMWVSSLCDSTAKGKPDIELVDMSSRFRTIDDIMDVTTKPIIFDGDTGGLTEHFVYTVRTLERMGVSAVIIEDKTGLKKNSLFGTEVQQTQDSIENFCSKIIAGKKALKTKEFMIVARIESLILEKGMEDALERANAYIKAGADGIMIHSRKKEPDEIFEFADRLREYDRVTPLIVVPTSYNTVTEDELKQHGINLVIYANQLTRSGFPAMKKAAELILKNHRAKEADDICMSIQDIITLIPEQD